MSPLQEVIVKAGQWSLMESWGVRLTLLDCKNNGKLSGSEVVVVTYTYMCMRGAHLQELVTHGGSFVRWSLDIMNLYMTMASV